MQPGQIHLRRSEMQRLLNQFNNFCHLRTSFDLEIQGIVQTSDQRVDEKCGTKFYKMSVSRFENYWINSIIFDIQITR